MQHNFVFSVTEKSGFGPPLIHNSSSEHQWAWCHDVSIRLHDVGPARRYVCHVLVGEQSGRGWREGRRRVTLRRDWAAGRWTGRQCRRAARRTRRLGDRRRRDSQLSTYWHLLTTHNQPDRHVKNQLFALLSGQCHRWTNEGDDVSKRLRRVNCQCLCVPLMRFLSFFLSFFLFFFLSYLVWHTLPSHASAEACLTGWPNAQPQGRD